MTTGKVTILGDNKDALSMCKHECNHATSRHYTVLMNFIRFMIETDQINVRYVATKENFANKTSRYTSIRLFDGPDTRNEHESIICPQHIEYRYKYVTRMCAGA